MQLHNMEQKSPEWFAVRQLKMTASHAQAIGNKGAGLNTYITQLLAEHYSSADKEGFSSFHTDRGNELEDVARSMYELEQGVETTTVGFIEDSKYSGCSPDGLIEENGGLEIKCPNDVEHYKIIRDQEKAIESKYLWQVQMNMFVTGRKWWDLVFYNPNFEKSLVIFRIKPDVAKQTAIKEGIEKGTEMIKEQVDKTN